MGHFAREHASPGHDQAQLTLIRLHHCSHTYCTQNRISGRTRLLDDPTHQTQFEQMANEIRSKNSTFIDETDIPLPSQVGMART